ncbi:MAG: transposase [Actinobacteria bacterium]|nr:transposase [Actinomycetota bacterium]
MSQGVLIVTGINSKGMRDRFAVEIADTENVTNWSELLRDLKRMRLARC